MSRPAGAPHPAQVRALLAGEHRAPRRVLGPHPAPGGVALVVLRPWAEQVAATGGRWPRSSGRGSASL
ncbi:hypothetical protein ABIA33_002439 [Streptacidiphilus sp. MAP12-16]|uniref:GlgB N-terminal domain-containing protein n=1 Tax=Streptacidiphilus sp. MAP12-16 TaxID=3156300 RepID=UPI0035177913